MSTGTNVLSAVAAGMCAAILTQMLHRPGCKRAHSEIRKVYGPHCLRVAGRWLNLALENNLSLFLIFGFMYQGFLLV
uniref:Uncharacterized protein n=1 Tax=Physcomitrium patens TaxID=3218 RepID=A0A7I4EZW7_PHYPA